jgi:hypothetical protein
MFVNLRMTDFGAAGFQKEATRMGNLKKRVSGSPL